MLFLIKELTWNKDSVVINVWSESHFGGFPSSHRTSVSYWELWFIGFVFIHGAGWFYFPEFFIMGMKCLVKTSFIEDCQDSDPHIITWSNEKTWLTIMYPGNWSFPLNMNVELPWPNNSPLNDQHIESLRKIGFLTVDTGLYSKSF